MKAHQILIPLVLVICGGATLWWQKHSPAVVTGPGPKVKLGGRGIDSEVPRGGTLKVEMWVSVGEEALKSVELLLDGKVVQTVAYGAPYPTSYTGTYNWNVRTPGPHTWQARAETSDGRKGDSGEKTVSVMTNMPPSVEVAHPQEGEVYAADQSTFYLNAGVKDEDDGIARVEFFLQGVKVAALTRPPWSQAVLPLHVGDYVFQVTATDVSGATTTVNRKFSVHPCLPYTASFTKEEGFSPGPLKTSSGWTIRNAPPEIVEEIGMEGKPGLRLSFPLQGDPTMIALGFPAARDQPPSGVIFHDVWLKPVADENILAASLLSVDRTELALLRTGTEAEVQANRYYTYNHRPLWRPTGVKVPVNEDGEALDWLRLTVRTDLKALASDVYVNGRMVLHDLPMSDGKIPPLQLRGHRKGDVIIGRVAVQAINPLFGDTGNDGIDDAWRLKYHLMGGRGRRLHDTDSDGLLDIDEYILKTDPRNPDTDGDGAPDGYEVRYGLDPLKPLTAAELASDADHDGVDLAHEIAQRTPPVPPPPFGAEWAD